MAVRNDPGTFLFSNASAAEFRAWASFIHNLLVTNGGWVDTAATGSIDLTTVAAPAAINTSMGYKVYRMADTLQATAPVFLKLEYGSGGTATFPAIWITVGTTHDGLGNIGNILLARVQHNASAAGTGGVHLGSADTNRACFCFATTGGSTNVQIWFSIERSKDAAGADTSAGLIVAYGTHNLRCVNAYLPFTGLVPPTEVGIHALLSFRSPSAFDGDVGVAAMIPMGTAPKQPGMNIILVRSNDFIDNASPVITIYGANHVYAHCGPNVNTLRAKSGSTLDDAGSRLCLRYE
jgi:hypothetical protein